MISGKILNIFKITDPFHWALISMKNLIHNSFHLLGTLKGPN